LFCALDFTLLFGALNFFSIAFTQSRPKNRFRIFSNLKDKQKSAFDTIKNALGSFYLAHYCRVSGIASAFLDNIPFTAAMIPVVLALASPPLSLPLSPLIW
jgi:hypothetical protein